MNLTVEVKRITDEIVEILGVTYYKEEYLREMMRREYERGRRESQLENMGNNFKNIEKNDKQLLKG